MIYYISTLDVLFRSLYAFLFCFSLCILVGKPLIHKLKIWQVRGQPIRYDGPDSHFVKYGTPTMGGLLILLGSSCAFIMFLDFTNPYIWIIYYVFFSFCLLGFVDDYLKIIYFDHKGISAKVKFLIQMIISSSALYMLEILVGKEMLHKIQIPYFDDLVIDIGSWIYIWGYIVVVGSANAVNLTDGLDGLASIPVILCSIGLMVSCYFISDVDLANSYSLFPVEDSQEIIVFLASLIGCCLGFLWFNSYPANIFMGDTGSLAIGGVLGITSMILKHEILFAIMGGVFVVEVLSVIIQVVYFKITKGKRIFKMSPLHHHYEKSGISETKIVSRFHIVSLVLLVIALSSLVT